jgi:H+/Cl- antiporter ClcA
MLAGLALILGVISAFLAYILLKLIALFTNIFFFGELSFKGTRPADADLGLFLIVIPIIGATIVGFMARYGSEKIRGHGIPEALEAILINGSRVEPKVAVLKPLSAAISIGSGGPFGAEGPIIMTGGSVGSLVAQFFHLSSAERKTLLVAGAAGGMSATFASPVAAVLLAVELLLFEWKPRSLIPVAVASVTALVVRRAIIGNGPLFPMEDTADLTLVGMLACLVVGLSAGALSSLVTSMVYASEDAFHRLPIHWMWWPPIGGLVIGIGGMFFPRALGVGYDTIGEMLNAELAVKTLFGVLIVKSIIWSVSLGSGTSGGVLAPLLMMGAAMGGLEAHILPDSSPGYYALIGMTAVLGGTIRAPLTASVFAVELTHDLDMLVPLFVGSVVSYGFTVLVMKRSILTEKVSRRGLHLSMEYSVDPLELFFVSDVMRPQFVALSPSPSPEDVETALLASQEIFPVLESTGVVAGIVTRADLIELQKDGFEGPEMVIAQPAAFASPRQTLRSLVRQMAVSRRTRLLVSDGEGGLAGIIELADVLQAYEKTVGAEESRARSLYLPWMRATDGLAAPPMG